MTISEILLIAGTFIISAVILLGADFIRWRRRQRQAQNEFNTLLTEIATNFNTTKQTIQDQLFSELVKAITRNTDFPTSVGRQLNTAIHNEKRNRK